MYTTLASSAAFTAYTSNLASQPMASIKLFSLGGMVAGLQWREGPEQPKIDTSSPHLKEDQSSSSQARAQLPNETPAECPLCVMVKAGPCRESFYPFESCLNRCDASGEDPAETCRAPFAAMMQCIVQHPDAYAKFLGKTTERPKNKENEKSGSHGSILGENKAA